MNWLERVWDRIKGVRPSKTVKAWSFVHRDGRVDSFKKRYMRRVFSRNYFNVEVWK